ncbi:MAG: M23 family metallopeptidase [Tannerellaceae bacterium]|jgi:murein DD-endopeptidase MepM/ murein hydrolase activator NlpD|nr:M23 family metallopeptidase [Tannerellaceae bacterium]
MARYKLPNLKEGRSFWSRIKFRYKLSFFNESALEEVWSFRLSLLSVIGTVLIFAAFLIAVTALFITQTSIRNLLPGYLDVEIRKEIVENAMRADSLGYLLQVQSRYLENIVGILSGTTVVDSVRQLASDSQASDYNIARGEKELAFVNHFEEEERYSLSDKTVATGTDGQFFYRPVKGSVSAGFAPEKKHYGIDLVAAPRESVLATQSGTVVYNGYDPKFGNVIHIQHTNGFISIYKHNDVVLKETGDPVWAGEAIALIGNTGHLTTGSHLHFELWFRGQPLNPSEYIEF